MSDKMVMFLKSSRLGTMEISPQICLSLEAEISAFISYTHVV